MKEPKTTFELQGTESKNAPAAKKERKPRANYIPIAERFKDITDIIWDEVCQKSLSDRLKSISLSRIVSPGDGMRWKRNEYDHLVGLGKWDAVQLSNEFIQIAQKKSTLSSVVRRYIEILLVDAMNITLEHYREIEQKRASKKSKLNDKSIETNSPDIE